MPIRLVAVRSSAPRRIVYARFGHDLNDLSLSIEAVVVSTCFCAHLPRAALATKGIPSAGPRSVSTHQGRIPCARASLPQIRYLRNFLSL